MKYHARLEDKFLWAGDGRNFHFFPEHCYGPRDGQDDAFLAFFDRFPEGTTRISYDEDTNAGAYCINGGEEVSEDGDLRCSQLKEIFDNQVTLVEHM